ncbi:unnamed protein product [Caenorhabditis angaria]|uniref:Uncharacterized protein n=1 Tax=Caenorhabditis angaria TaxID=860376 RepID=A0A9P1MSC4_9PELO|nr:unnamed protein product [Caenorhabditis angaria]
MKLCFIFLTIFSNLVFSTNTNIRAQTTLKCFDSNNNPRSFEFEVNLWEIDQKSEQDKIFAETSGESYGNITVVSKGTPKIDHPTDEKRFWIWSWIQHNCTTSGNRICAHVDLGEVNSKITGVNYVYTVNLHNQNLDRCNTNHRKLE